MWKRFGSNAFANILSGGSSIAFQLCLTAMAARSFDAPTFAAWTLALSMAGLTPLFAVNLSAIVTRQLVPLMGSGQLAGQSVVMGSAQSMGRALSLLAVVAIAAAALGLHRASPALSAVGLMPFALTVVLLTLGQLWQVSLQPAYGWHYAHEHNWPVAGAQFLIRICALVALWWALHWQAGKLLATALAFALGHWVGAAGAMLAFLAPKVPRAQPDAALQRQRAETLGLLKGFAIWSIGMAVIQYGLPALMSILASQRYNAFYLAFALNLVVTGVVGAIGSALLAPVARLAAQDRPQELVRWLNLLPAVIAALLLALLLALSWAMDPIVRHWSKGIADVADVRDYLFFVGLQTIARSLTIGHAMVLSARAKAWQLVMPTLIEIAVAVAVAAPIGWLWGDRAFLLALWAAGLSAAVAVAVSAGRVANLPSADRLRLLMRLALVEAVASGLWLALAR